MSQYIFSFIRMKYYFLFFVVLVLFFIYELEAGQMCYQAKICIHTGVERCGLNSKGKLRRFIDSCDMLEYNCLKNNDYSKTSKSRCSVLSELEYLKDTIISNETRLDERLYEKEFYAENLETNENISTTVENIEDVKPHHNFSTEQNEHSEAISGQNVGEIKHSSDESNEKIEEKNKSVHLEISKEETMDKNIYNDMINNKTKIDEAEATEVHNSSKKEEDSVFKEPVDDVGEDSKSDKSIDEE